MNNHQDKFEPLARSEGATCKNCKQSWGNHYGDFCYVPSDRPEQPNNAAVVVKKLARINREDKENDSSSCSCKPEDDTLDLPPLEFSSEKIADALIAKTLSSFKEQIGGSHYKDMKIQPVDFIMANDIGFMEGSAIKYLSRWKAKGGVEDLKKARHFIDMLIENQGDNNENDK